MKLYHFTLITPPYTVRVNGGDGGEIILPYIEDFTIPSSAIKLKLHFALEIKCMCQNFKWKFCFVPRKTFPTAIKVGVYSGK